MVARVRLLHLRRHAGELAHAVHDFSFAARGCPELANGTAFEYGPAGPTKGHVVFDAGRKVVLYQEGCCAERTTILASGVGAPPMSVRSASLGLARTARGVALE